MKKRESGFTLIELLIVIAIIGILAAIAIPNLLNAVQRGKQKRSMSDMRTLATAIESYAVDLAVRHYASRDTPRDTAFETAIAVVLDYVHGLSLGSWDFDANHVGAKIHRGSKVYGFADLPLDLLRGIFRFRAMRRE